MTAAQLLDLTRAGRALRSSFAPTSPAAATTPTRAPEPRGELPSDRDFFAMRLAYRPTGGLARGDDLARLLADRGQGDFVSLARLIVAGEVFAFEWHGTPWVPMFQFELRDLSIKPAPHQVLAELAHAFDGWSVAIWFAQPNCWLKDRKPVDLLECELPAVLEAARADRFIAIG